MSARDSSRPAWAKMAKLQDVMEYGTLKDFVACGRVSAASYTEGARLHGVPKRACVRAKTALIGANHRVRPVLNGSQYYRLRDVKFTGAVE